MRSKLCPYFDRRLYFSLPQSWLVTGNLWTPDVNSLCPPCKKQTLQRSTSNLHLNAIYQCNAHYKFNVKFRLLQELYRNVSIINSTIVKACYMHKTTKQTDHRPLNTGPIKYSERSVTTTTHCVISQKTADLIYLAAEAWNRAYLCRGESFADCLWTSLLQRTKDRTSGRVKGLV
jgi:hypothetical protein